MRNLIQDHLCWDVIVCGSGPAGLGAAVAAAKLGAKVLLLEAAGQPGGTICAVPFMPINRLRINGNIRSAVHETFVQHLYATAPEGAYAGPEDRINGDGICPHPEYAELAIYSMLEEAGVTLRLFSPVIDAEVQDGTLCAVLVREKRGIVRYQAKRFVDATGDGDLAAAAGCTFSEGRDVEPTDDSVRFHVVDTVEAVSDGKPVHMPITLGFSLVGIDCPRFFAWFDTHREEYQEMLRKADEDGRYVAAWYAYNHGTAPGVLGVNNGAWMHQPLTSNALCAEDLTDARRNGVRVAADLAAIFRENAVPGAEHAVLDRVGGILGVRDTRRILGQYVVTFADSQHSQEFPDTIARKYGAIDANQLFIGSMDSGFAYPYRALVPQDVDGLLLAGRCASATFLGHSAGKSMGNMMALGCAAGAAAALCAQDGTSPGELEVSRLQTVLTDTLHAAL